MAEIPPTVQQFLAQNIHSISELEILLLLRDHSPEKWPVEAIGKALLLHRPAVEPRLASLRSSGLIAVRDVEGISHFQYAPNPEAAKVIDELARWYSTHPVAITTLIFSKPMDKMRIFADSFRLRKKEDE